jgi:hypothetical protein
MAKKRLILLFCCPEEGCRWFQKAVIASVPPGEAFSFISGGSDCKFCDGRRCFIGILR